MSITTRGVMTLLMYRLVCTACERGQAQLAHDSLSPPGWQRVLEGHTNSSYARSCISHIGYKSAVANELAPIGNRRGPNYSFLCVRCKWCAFGAIQGLYIKYFFPDMSARACCRVRTYLPSCHRGAHSRMPAHRT